MNRGNQKFAPSVINIACDQQVTVTMYCTKYFAIMSLFVIHTVMLRNSFKITVDVLRLDTGHCSFTFAKCCTKFSVHTR